MTTCPLPHWMRPMDRDYYDMPSPDYSPDRILAGNGLLSEQNVLGLQVVGAFMERSALTQAKFLPSELRGPMPTIRRDEFGCVIVSREPNRSGS